MNHCAKCGSWVLVGKSGLCISCAVSERLVIPEDIYEDPDSQWACRVLMILAVFFAWPWTLWVYTDFEDSVMEDVYKIGAGFGQIWWTAAQIVFFFWILSLVIPS